MTKKSENAVALVVPSVIDGITLLRKQLEGLKHIADSVYVTKKNLNDAEISIDSVNLETETSVPTLINFIGGIISAEKQYQEGVAVLGMQTVPVFKIGGSTVAEWTKDVKLRIDIINNKDHIDAITGMIKEYEALMDRDDKKALLDKKLAAMVAGK